MSANLMKYLTVVLYVVCIALVFTYHLEWPRVAFPLIVAIVIVGTFLYPQVEKPPAGVIFVLILLVTGFIIDLWTTIFLSGRWDAGLYIGIGLLGMISWLVVVLGLFLIPIAVFERLTR